MSLERSNRKEPEKASYDPNQLRVKASYTQQGFYRKNNNNAGMNFSNLSQKQSIYDHKYNQHVPQNTSQFGYSTLNPGKYAIEPSLAPKEEQYQIVIEFELKRQREKNRILEERLKNKEIFMSQMKRVQEQLTDAFKNCQEELEFYKKKNSQLNMEIREHLEQISELRHLVIKLEDQKTEYQKRENKRFSSVKREKDEDNRKSVSRFKDDGSRISKVTKEKRSKTMVNQRDSSPEFKKFDIIEEYVVKFAGRVGSFISQFFAMVECFSQQAQNASKGQEKHNIKRRLKIGWKWIKSIVAEWNSYKANGEKYENFHKKLKKIFKIVDGTTDTQAMDLILSALRE